MRRCFAPGSGRPGRSALRLGLMRMAQIVPTMHVSTWTDAARVSGRTSAGRSRSTWLVERYG